MVTLQIHCSAVVCGCAYDSAYKAIYQWLQTYSLRGTSTDPLQAATCAERFLFPRELNVVHKSGIYVRYQYPLYVL